MYKRQGKNSARQAGYEHGHGQTNAPDAGEHEKNAAANGKNPGNKRPDGTPEADAGAHACLLYTSRCV